MAVSVRDVSVADRGTGRRPAREGRTVRRGIVSGVPRGEDSAGRATADGLETTPS